MTSAPRPGGSLAVVLTGLFALWFFVPAPQASQLITNLQAGKNQKIVVYGTSLTVGGQWVADTASWLEGLYPGQVTLINSGMSGRASNSAVANVQARVIDHAPDTVFIEFAVNDAFAYPSTNSDHGITLAKSQANLNQVIDAILQAKPDTEIILQTMNPAWDGPDGSESAAKRPNLAAYYEVCREVAAARGLLLIDHHVNWSRLEAEDPARFQTYLPDGLHPTSTGSTAVTFAEIQRGLLSASADTAPAGLAAVSGDAQVSLTWNGVAGATGYTVKRANARGGPYTPIAPGLSGSDHVDTGLANGTTYYYRVSATVGGGESADSLPVPSTPLSFPLTTVTVTPAWAGAPAREIGPAEGGFVITRQGPSYTNPLSVSYTVGGTALNDVDYVYLPGTVTIPAGADSVLLPITPVADALSEGDETVTFILNAEAGYELTPVAMAQLTLKDRPIDDWRFTRFTAEQRADTATGGYLADPDRDGRPNLLEYAFGLDPLTAEGAGVNVAIQDGHLTMIFRRRLGAFELTYLPESSSRPSSSWASGPTLIEETILSDGSDGFHLVQARALTASAPDLPRFLRLRVILR